MTHVSDQPQHLAALAEANRVRFARARLGRELCAGEARLSEVLRRDPSPEWLATETLMRLLRRIPRVGTKRASRVLGDLGIGDSRRVGDVSPRQRRAIADAVERMERPA